MWPSTLMAERAAERLASHGHQNRVEHLDYPGAGHGIYLPNLPTTTTTQVHPVQDASSPSAAPRAMPPARRLTPGHEWCASSARIFDCPRVNRGDLSGLRWLLRDRDSDVQVLAGLDLPLGDLLAGGPPDARLGLDRPDQLLQAEHPAGPAADPRMHGKHEGARSPGTSPGTPGSRGGSPGQVRR